MPCPHSGTADSEGVSRRDFFRVAVAIGGASALSACVQRAERATTTGGDDDLPDLPTGDPASVPERQHSWTEYVLTDGHGNPKFPEYQSFLFVDYERDGPPTDEDRTVVESALSSLEEAFVWGAGQDAHQQFFHDGLFVTISYSPSYFERFDASVPESAGLQAPETVLEAVGEDRSKADDYDAVLHLGTDYPEVLLATELALFGERQQINGVEMDAHLGEVFRRRERRAGFVGEGLPAERLDEERVSEEAPASMGFKSGLRDNLPGEDAVTIDEGPFAGGTTLQVSQLTIDLDAWYDEDFETRVHRMYSPHHTTDDVGEAGKNVAADSGVTEEMAASTPEDAADGGVVGHAQKLARVRDDEFTPLILRRGDFNAAHPDGSTLHFGSIQREISDLVETLEAMYDPDLEGQSSAVEEEDDGIVSVLETVSRGTYLMPTRDLRALPPARPE